MYYYIIAHLCLSLKKLMMQKCKKKSVKKSLKTTIKEFSLNKKLCIYHK